MSPEEFAKKIRTKYPTVYDDIPDTELAQKVIDKYPVYADKVDFAKSTPQVEETESRKEFFGSPLQAVKEFGAGVKEAVTETGQRVVEEQKSSVSGEQPAPLAGLGITADLVRGAGNVGLEVLKLVSPKFVEDAAKKGFQTIGEALQDSETVQNIQQNYSEFKQANPQTAKSLEDLAVLTEVLPIGKGVSAARQGIRAGGEAVQKAVGKAEELFVRAGVETQSVKDSLKNLSRDLISRDKIATKNISREVDDTISTNKGIQRKVREASQKGTDVTKYMKEPIIYKGIEVENGRINPDSALETIQNRIDTAMNAKRTILPILDDKLPKVQKSQVEEYVKERATGKELPAEEKATLSAIEKQLADMPDEFTMSELDDIRAKARNSARDNRGISKGNEFSAIENGVRDLIFDITDNLPFDESGQFKALNDYVKDMLNTRKFFDEQLRGQTVKGGRLGTFSGRVVGSIAGSPGGVFGSLVGSEVGAFVADILRNNQLGSSMKMQLIREVVDDPAVLSEIESLITGAKNYTPPALPAGTPGAPRVRLQGGDTIKLPEKTTPTGEAPKFETTGRR